MNDETLKEKCYRLQKERDYRLDTDKYIIAHIDGRSFSHNIKNKFKKPFDRKVIDMMNETAIYLCENVQGAKIAYVQSDEISLLIKKDTPESDVFFGGRMCKMQSIIASLATAKFNQLLAVNEIWSNAYDNTLLDCESTLYTIKDAVNKLKNSKLVEFDCKVWDVDTANDALAWFLFRNIDCVKNSKQQVAQTWCSYNELLRLDTDKQIEFLKEKNGIDWYAFPEDEKYGRIVKKIVKQVQREMPNGEIIDYERSVWEAIPGVDLSDKEKRKEFVNNYPFFKE